MVQTFEPDEMNLQAPYIYIHRTEIVNSLAELELGKGNWPFCTLNQIANEFLSNQLYARINIARRKRIVVSSLMVSVRVQPQ